MFRRQTRGRCPRVCLWNIPRHSDSPEGNFFQISSKAFPQSARLWFSRGARISPKGPLWKNLGKPAVRSVHSKSLMENKSLYTVNPRLHLWETKDWKNLGKPAVRSVHSKSQTAQESWPRMSQVGEGSGLTSKRREWQRRALSVN